MNIILLDMARIYGGSRPLLSATAFWTFLYLFAVTIPQTIAGRSSTAAPLASSSSNATQIISVDGPINSTLEATAWALIYTYPLYIFGNFAGSVLRNVSVNEIFHQRNLASISSSAVIKPNTDTLYSRVVLDLSQNDIVLTVPRISDGRYWNYPVYDAFGNQIANIGVVNSSAPGKYLIRRADDVSESSCLQQAIIQDSTTVKATYEGIVNLPTTYGTMLIRLLVQHNTTAELNTLHAYQNASHLAPVNRTVAQTNALATPKLTDLAPNGTFLGIDTPSKLLKFAAQVAPHNQPETYSDRYRVASILGQAGLFDGKYVQPAHLNLTLAAAIANASITAQTQNASNIRYQGNGWEISIPSFQGNFSTNYAPRAYIAITGYQQQTVDQTLYPGYQGLSFNTLNLAAGKSLLLTYSGKPLLHPSGFWSLTMYGADQYLVPNIINRPEVGDRTNLTYGDGGFVYGPEANATRDGPFQILVQPADLAPPKNWTNNWLPAPRGGGDYSFILRWYVSTEAMTNGTYVYPKAKTIPAIQ